MELYPVDPLGLATPDPVDSGWAQRIRHGPLSVDQVLGRGLAAMLAEDEEERLRGERFAFVTGPRRPSLLSRLFRRR